MSAIEETTRSAGSGKDTHSGTSVGGVHPVPAMPDKVLAQLRNAGPALPRGPRPGQPWTPRTAAEIHLLGEVRRMDRVRQLLLGELGRLRHLLGATRADGRERREETARTANRQSGCPLPPSQLNVLAAAACGESVEETAARMHVAWDTVHSHRKRAIDRLEARSIIHAVALAVAAGWITPEPTDRGDT